MKKAIVLVTCSCKKGITFRMVAPSIETKTCWNCQTMTTVSYNEKGSVKVESLKPLSSTRFTPKYKVIWEEM